MEFFKIIRHFWVNLCRKLNHIYGIGLDERRNKHMHDDGNFFDSKINLNVHLPKNFYTRNVKCDLHVQPIEQNVNTCMGKQINFLFYFLILDFDAFRLWQNELWYYQNFGLDFIDLRTREARLEYTAMKYSHGAYWVNNGLGIYINFEWN